MNWWIGYTFIGCVLILFAELLSGYIVAQYGRPAEPAVLRAARLLLPSFNSDARNNLTDAEQRPIRADNLNNPFMSNAPDSILVRLHPFIDFSNVHALSTDGTVSSTSNDFFGFRNETNFYFENRDADDLFIVLSGGSECAGYSHIDLTISDALQQQLQAYTAKNVKVLNLCMNSYVLAHEIQTYVHLGYEMKPDLVISHSGWNDVIYGLLVSEEFLQTGLIYNKAQELWLEPLYSAVKETPPPNIFASFNTDSSALITQAYVRQAQKYKEIANSNGSVFILGLQSYNPIIENDGMREIHEDVHRTMNLISDSLPQDLGSGDVSTEGGAITFVDSVHSSQDSVSVIAEIYVQYILNDHSSLLE